MLEDAVYSARYAYLRLPDGLRVPLGAAYGALPASVRHGRVYARWSAWLPRSEQLPRQDLDELQWMRLKVTLSYAYQKVPWYGRLWAQYGLAPRQIQSPSDLHLVPVTSKADVRHNFEQFISTDARPRDVLPILTTGSTGAPTRIGYTRGVTHAVEWAFIHSLWGRVGYRENCKVAALRGADLHGRRDGTPWMHDPSRNRWSYSSVDLSPAGCRRILRHMQATEPEFLHVFPSALTSLATTVCADGLESPLPSLRAILAGSETIASWQIEVWRRAFGPKVKILRWYGLTERAALAGSCEESLAYHVYPQYSYVELLHEPDESSTDLSNDGSRAQRVIGTSFDNWVMPLIRYDTGDAAIAASSECACGRPYRTLVDVVGRANAWAQTRSGDWVPFTHIAAGIETSEWAEVLRLQFMQEAPGRLQLLLVPATSTTRSQLEAMVAALRRTIGGQFALGWDTVDSIDALPGGKHAYFVQHLSGPELIPQTAVPRPRGPGAASAKTSMRQS